MASNELIVAPKAASFGRTAELTPASWSGPDRDPLLIRAAARAGEVRRAMSRVVHDVRYRPPRRRTAKLLVLIPAHNEEGSIGNVLNALLTQTRVPDRIVVIADNCLQQLEADLAATPRPGGVMARYTFDQRLGASGMARMLIRMQRLEFASWTADALRRNRKTYVRGGQAPTPGRC